MVPPKEFLVQPDPADPRLTRRVEGIDQAGAPVTASVTVAPAWSCPLPPHNLHPILRVCIITRQILVFKA